MFGLNDAEDNEEACQEWWTCSSLGRVIAMSIDDVIKPKVSADTLLSLSLEVLRSLSLFQLGTVVHGMLLYYCKNFKPPRSKKVPKDVNEKKNQNQAI